MTIKSSIMSVYSGEAGACLCGCSGNHRYASKHVRVASKNRGYDIEKHEVNDRQVKKVIAILEAHPAELEITDSLISADVDGKTYVAYLLPRK